MSFWWPRFYFGSNLGENIFGGNGRDIVFAFGGNDSISTGLGNDIVFSGRGNDSVDAGAGNDSVFAGSGDDTVHGGAGNDKIFGGRGFDTATYEGSIEDYTFTTFGAFTRVESFGDVADAGVDKLFRVEALYFAADDLTLFIDGTNNAVLAADDAVATSEDGTLSISAADLLDNDREFDGDTIFVSDVDGVSGSGANVTLVDGVITYDPGTLFDALGAEETAEDTFTYTVDDGRGGTDTATVTVTVQGVNDGPVLLATDASVAENSTAVMASVSATDVDSDVLTFSLGGVDAALFTIDADTGEIAFAEAPNFEAPGDADGDNVYDLTVEVDDNDGGSDSVDIQVTVSDLDEIDARLNELHYDNSGGDVGEFVEIRIGEGTDPARVSVELYNGSNGGIYNTLALGEDDKTSTLGGFDYYLIELPTNGLQNGSPDGIAIIGDGAVIEFLSYEGSFIATDGTAAGLESTDIGVAETGGTPIGASLERDEDGDGWSVADEDSRGLNNDFVAPADARINELHYDNAGTDVGEFVEIRVALGEETSGLLVEFYRDSGTVYRTETLPSDPVSMDDTFAYYVIELPSNGIQNGDADGLALSDNGTLIELLSYEGTLTATEGTAVGVTSTDIGVSEPGSTPIGQSLQRNEDGTWRGPEENTQGAANDAAPEPLNARINEFHYDNAGSDVGEFVEVRVEKGQDVSGLLLEFYRDSGTVYRSEVLPDTPASEDDTFAYYVVSLPTNGIQNGDADGIALSNNGELIELLSYEGTLTATDGTAAGETSTDIGVSETGTTPVGQSLQRNLDGTWRGPEENTLGVANDVVTAPDVSLNELAVNSTGSPDFEFFELFGAAGTSLDGLSLIQVEAATDFNPGNVLTVINLDGQSIGEDGFFLAASPEAEADFGVVGDLQIADDSFENFDSSFLLVRNFAGSESTDLDADDDGVIDAPLEIVDGVALADAGPSLFYGDVPVIGPDGNFLAPGAKRETDGDGAFVQTAFSDVNDYTPGSTNAPPPPAEITLISTIQGAGDESAFVGQQLTVSAVVTQILDGRGFFLQEEDVDADADLSTSEGIFVFTGGGTAITLGDLVEVSGTVSEFGGETQLGGSITANVIASNVDTPTATQIALNPAVAQDFEAVEGMLITVSSGTSDPLTVIENFNLDRFGEITISAGTQTQATQLFDAQTEAASVAATIEGNLNNRILLDDGLTSQNPDEFVYLPGGAGDNGNGFLDAGDDFGDAGSTLRLGSELTADVTGALGFGFGEYRLYSQDVLQIDEATNVGARDAAPEDVGGTLQLSSFNVLNYFTTFSGNTLGGVGVRGADNQDELDRQSDKIVQAMEATGADVFALQELENGGFAEGTAIDELVDRLNAQVANGAGPGSFAFVNPTGVTAPNDTGGLIGSDAITNGIVYDSSKVQLIHSDFIVFDEASAATTFALADVLNQVASSDDQVGDFQRNRPSVAATFEELDENGVGTGNTFTVVSSHFKSKGDSNLQDVVGDAQAHVDGGGTTVTQADIDALIADPNYDQGNGQGFWNKVREDAAFELQQWIENDYNVEGGGAGNYVLLGDLNAYAEEDPVDALDDTGGLVDLIDSFDANGATTNGQDTAYSFVFDGQQGSLDHALGNDGFASLVTGLTEWHINADEPDLINYDTDFNNPAFYNPGVFGASDHDPLILGIDFDPLLLS